VAAAAEEHGGYCCVCYLAYTEYAALQNDRGCRISQFITWVISFPVAVEVNPYVFGWSGSIYASSFLNLRHIEEG
jgi:hypothetical protein